MKRIRVSVGPTAPILFVVFMVLKLTHVIDWSWWWITAPLWAPLAVLIVIAVIIGGVILIRRDHA